MSKLFTSLTVIKPGLRFRNSNWQKTSFVHALVFFINALAIGLVISCAILELGLGLTTDIQCHTAIVVCLVFYTLERFSLYIFLVERAHIPRANKFSRCKDPIWVIFMAAIIFFAGGVSIAAYMTPVSFLSPVNGLCKIGFLISTASILIGIDSTLSLALTGLFVYFVWQVISFRFKHAQEKTSKRELNSASSAPTLCLRCINDDTIVTIDTGWDSQTQNTTAYPKIKAMLIKNVAASVALAVSPAVNAIIFFIHHGQEENWLCFTTCMVDGKHSSALRIPLD